ncbi:cytochrome c [Paracoccus sp. (in: a-proteobacteria)]|uniref:cytochrome c n=1 Tax=Paracoccus sp. TaxID=267 RepID=UPI0026DF7C65|nr:cytochrome c [Paracoccus sp. (in: a-proteobacteria)]MDO5648590.1 cytochrome c [Paracoccus sp. (in: a-proteobacteria)]
MKRLIVLALLAGPAQAEPLTGPFGPHGEKHPIVEPFATPAAGITELRQRSMAALSGHFRASSATVFAGAGGDAMLPTHADAMAALAAQMDALFAIPSPAPDGAKGALPAIWDDPARFAEYTAGFAAQTRVFAQAVRDGGDTEAALQDVRYMCLACHAAYRQR